MAVFGAHAENSLRRACGRIDLEFVQRERTPRELMASVFASILESLAFEYRSELEKYGVERSRRAAHEWVYKADLVPIGGAKPAKMALYETVIWIDGQQYWLYAAVNPAANRFLHVRLYSTHTTAIIEMFLAELMENHDVEDAIFLIDSAAGSKLHFTDAISNLSTKDTVIETLSNVFTGR